MSVWAVVLVALVAAVGHQALFAKVPAHSSPRPQSPAYSEALDNFRSSTVEVSASIRGLKFAVVGGNGFTGGVIVEDFVQRGAEEVRVLSRSGTGAICSTPKVRCFGGGTQNEEALQSAIRGADVVFHLAAYYGDPQFGSLDPDEYKKAYDTNVDGMHRLLRVARDLGVKLFVFTSSVDVVLTEHGFENGTEASLPYAQKVAAGEPACHYQRTKALAEELCLAANSDAMATVALRPGGIHGPGENTFLPKVVSVGWATGWHLSSFGPSRLSRGDEQKLDWTFVYNIAWAHALVVHSKFQRGSSLGKAFFVTDGRPTNVGGAKMFEPVLNAVGIELWPLFHVPAALLLGVARVFETASWWSRTYFGIALPIPLTMHEVRKITTTHTCSLEAASRELGYYPAFRHEEAWAWTAEEFKRRYVGE